MCFLMGRKAHDATISLSEINLSITLKLTRLVELHQFPMIDCVLNVIYCLCIYMIKKKYKYDVTGKNKHN